MSCVDRYWRQLCFQQDGILWYRLSQRHSFLPPTALPPGSAQHRWTLTEAINHRPGFSRALLQSRKRLALDVVPDALLGLEPAPATDLTLFPDPQDLQKCDQPDLYPSGRQLYGRIEGWKDYFETSLFLEREWIEGKPTMKELRGHVEAVLCVKTLCHGERIASGDRLGFLKVWCTITGECLKTIKRHMMGISCFAAQGDLLVSGSWVCEALLASTLQWLKDWV